MRLFLLPLFFLMACSVSGGTQSDDAAVALICPPQTGQTDAAALCSALEVQLQQRGYRLHETGATRLVLDAESPRPGILKARLTVQRDGASVAGEQGELTVMDRDTIPAGQIERFATNLLDRANLPRP